MFFNKFVRKIKPYKVSSHKAWEEGMDDVLKLDWNESTISPSPNVKDALAEFIRSTNLNWYPNVNNTGFRQKLANYVGVDSENVDYFASSDATHEYVLRAFIDPEDVVAMVGPTYDNFRATAESMGASVELFKLNETEGFNFNVGRFDTFMESVAPKICYICNPNNPTGTLYSRDVLIDLIKRYNDVLFIIDEAYYEFDRVTVSDYACECENVIVTRTFSKAFALASFRIGYAVSSKHNLEGIKKIRNPKNISADAQVAASAALDDLDYMNDFVAEVKLAKIETISTLGTLGVETIASESGNYVLVDFGSHTNELVAYLEDQNIFVRRYSHVGGMERYTRITIGTRPQMKRVVTAIERFLNG